MTPALVFVCAFALATAADSGSPPEIVFEGAGPFQPASIHQVVTMDLDGMHRQALTADGTNKFLPHFSPDGTRILYSKFLTGSYGDPASVTAVAVYDIGTRRETVIVPRGAPVVSAGTPFQPVWSPDGARIAFGSRSGDGLWIMNADGSDVRAVGHPSGSPGDFIWGDPVWSNDDWIFFTVGQVIGGCFKVRIDKMRPDATERVPVTDGGPSCTPPGLEQSGDADPGVSADGRTVFSSRGVPRRVPGLPDLTVRHLYVFSSDPWTPGKPELDLSAGAKNDCIAGVPKASPDGTRVLLFLFCADDPGHAGVTLTDRAGSSWNFLSEGFGPDWNPAAGNSRVEPIPPNGRRGGKPRAVVIR